MLKVEDLAKLIHGRRVGRRAWRGQCPVHRGNSLEVKQGKSSVVIKCWGGCDTADVLAALGLSWADVLGERRQISPELRERLKEERLLEYWLAKRKEALVAFADTRPKIPISLWGDAKDVDEFIQRGGDYRKVLASIGDWWGAEDVPGYAKMTRRIEFIRDKLQPGRKAAREKKEKLDRFIAKYGWDRLWDEFLKTEHGQEVLFEWGVTKE